MKHILEFERWSLNEGGKVFDGTRSITQGEARSTIEDLKKELFPLLGLEMDKNAILLGSATRKPEDQLSGDIDIGTMVPLPDIDASLKEVGKVSGSNWMQGLDVLSISWPIDGDANKGYVQVDFIPVKDREWTEFVYAYPKGSKYKSAHRNWLLAAIVSILKERKTYDDVEHQMTSYEGYMFKLNDGLYRIRKDFRGTTKVLKHGDTQYDSLVTRDPVKFVKFLFGDKFGPDDVATVEQCLDIMKDQDFKYKNRKDEIIDQFTKFLERAKLPVPIEINNEI